MDGYSEADEYGNSKIWRHIRSGQKKRVVLSEELLILASCLLRPMRKNSFWRSSAFEDLQSSRKRFDLEHCEGDLCWSLSESEGKKDLSVICVEVMV